ncbi:hypothetical protein A2V49_02805 [candidate division WWE3 bacterium RBG_19FT_COMBO_34_6]|uniref:Uncharacterized protein n=1 Tax=candidate division WWE3 bacterium RBG_19FT_COMBO_34_6 TaxID=1802612 RepID=A0A1F4UNC9_UNCKA|nr:MAG: hypothetical protein A2V49_02805 [candidate division WWE3 bacterium RBG_19FT_COMBO_34_6]
MKQSVSKIIKKFSKLKLPVKIILLIIIILLGWFTYSKFIKSKPTQTQYQTALVQRGTLVSTVTASGQVSSANNTPIVTQVTGKITKLYVKNGDQVKVGAPIAKLELDQSSQQKYYQQLSSYTGAKNSLESAKANKDSLKSDVVVANDNFVKNALNKGKDEDNVTYIQLKAAKDLAEQKYNNQDQVIYQAQMSYSSASMALQNYSPTIYAPISGVITGLSQQEGSVIPAQAVSSSTQTLSQNIANITTSNYPIVSVAMTEIDIPKVQVGAKATLTFDAYPDKTYTGKVFCINTTGLVSSGVTSYPVTINLDTENPEIYANMSATANIIIETKDNVLYVPVSAVQDQNGQSVVRELKDDQLVFIAVVTGISSDTYTEIVSGVNEGDEVVTSVITQTTGSTNSGSASPFGVFRPGGGGNVRFRD